MSNRLYFDDGEDIVELECHSLSCWSFVIKRLHVEGSQRRLEAVDWLLKGRCRVKIYFSSSGLKFKVDPSGYHRSAAGQWESKDTRQMADIDKLWDVVNTEPFNTPMLREWEPQLRLFLQGAYVKPLNGYKPTGLYLDHALHPARLDEIVCGLVKRKVLKFIKAV